MSALTTYDSDTSGWYRVWNRPGRVPLTLPGNAEGTVLGALLSADGITTGVDDLITEHSWTESMLMIADELGISENDSVFSIGCGAGADLYPFYTTLGCRVGGIDLSQDQIGLARQAMPEFAAGFSVADATSFSTSLKYSVVICMGVLMYVPISRAGQVIDLAFEKTLPGGTVGIFDVPRLSTKQQAIAYRVAQAGGLKAYNSRYGPGMQHQYYPDDWAPREMEAVGLVDVRMLPPMLGSGGSCAFRDFFVGHKP